MIKIGEKKIYKNFKVRKPLEIEAGETLTVATHGNVFHADEIVAIALLRIYYKGYNMKVIRSSCINDIKNSDFAINVGRQNKITDSQVRFDCTKEDNVYILGTGIKHCAATKVAQYLNVPESLFKKCLFGLAIDENNQNISTKYPNPFNFIKELNEGFDGFYDKKKQEKQFRIAIDMTVVILESLLKRCKLEMECKQLFDLAISKMRYGAIMLDHQFRLLENWKDYIYDYNKSRKFEDKIKFLIMRDWAGYNVTLVHVSKDSEEPLVEIPKEWAGLKNKDLADAVGIDCGAISCSRDRKSIKWRSKYKVYDVIKIICEKAEAKKD